MTDTPRTDEQINGKPCERMAIFMGNNLRDALVPSEFARQLERENAEIMAKWESDKRIFCGALQLLKEAGYAPDSTDLLSASERFDKANNNNKTQT